MDTSAIAQFVPLILIFAIMYFLLIRPQQKKMKEHQNMVAALRRGDQVVTQGGLIGKVVKVKEDNELEVEMAEGVKVGWCSRPIAQVLSKTEPAATPEADQFPRKAPSCCRSNLWKRVVIWGLVALGVVLRLAERLLLPRGDSQRRGEDDRAAGIDTPSSRRRLPVWPVFPAVRAW